MNNKKLTIIICIITIIVITFGFYFGMKLYYNDKDNNIQKSQFLSDNYIETYDYLFKILNVEIKDGMTTDELKSLLPLDELNLKIDNERIDNDGYYIEFAKKNNEDFIQSIYFNCNPKRDNNIVRLYKPSGFVINKETKISLYFNSKGAKTVYNNLKDYFDNKYVDSHISDYKEKDSKSFTLNVNNITNVSSYGHSVKVEYKWSNSDFDIITIQDLVLYVD